jgi:hypothetical protein
MHKLVGSCLGTICDNEVVSSRCSHINDDIVVYLGFTSSLAPARQIDLSIHEPILSVSSITQDYICVETWSDIWISQDTDSVRD